MPFFERAKNIIITGGVFNESEPGSTGTVYLITSLLRPNLIPERTFIADVKRIKEYMDDAYRQRVLNWISQMDFSAKHYDIVKSRQAGTLEWFTESELFKSWVRTAGRVIWCPGNPGVGKTVLSSFIIDYLLARQHFSPPHRPIGIAWVYFNYKESAAQTPDAIYLSIIRQLAINSTELYQFLESSPLRKSLSQRCPSPYQLIPDPQKLTKIFERVFIDVDALDECSIEYWDTVLRILSTLNAYGTNIFITSRHHVYGSIAHASLCNMDEVAIHGRNADIANYINSQLARQRHLAVIIGKNPALREDIVNSILDSCQGMFLMATFHMGSLGQCRNVREIRNILANLPRTVVSIYKEAVDRVESDQAHAKLALRTLSILVHARRQLHLRELQHFLAVNSGDPDLDEEAIIDKDLLLSICAGLVIADEKAKVVRLVHFTAQEYFDQIRTSIFPDGDQEMGLLCLTYLSFSSFKDITTLVFSRSITRYLLLRYIVCHWKEHISDHQDALKSQLLVFFNNAELRHAYLYFIVLYGDSCSYSGQLIDSNPLTFYTGSATLKDYRRFKHSFTNIHAAAVSGLLKVTDWLISTSGVNINSVDEIGRTPLLCSCFKGCINVVALLANGSNQREMVAKYKNTLAMTRLLLGHGADPNIPDAHCRTPLLLASESGDESLVKLLLDHGAKTDTPFDKEDSPFVRASRHGHKAVVRLLLKHGANINNQGRSGTALMAAAGPHSTQELVQLLIIEQRANISHVGSALTIGPGIKCNVQNDVAESRPAGSPLKLIPQDAHKSANSLRGGVYPNLTGASDSMWEHVDLMKAILECGVNAALEVVKLFEQNTEADIKLALQRTFKRGYTNTLKPLTDHQAKIDMTSSTNVTSSWGYLQVALKPGLWRLNMGSILAGVSSMAHIIILNVFKIFLSHGFIN